MIAIRPARREDLPAIERLTERLADFDQPKRLAKRDIARADDHLLLPQLESPRDDVLFLIAEDAAGTPLGTVFAGTHSDYFTKVPIAYVEVIAVAREAEGTGLARRLLTEVEQWAEARGLHRVDLSVFAVNQRARGFYEHLGYTGEFVRYAKELGKGR